MAPSGRATPSRSVTPLDALSPSRPRGGGGRGDEGGRASGLSSLEEGEAELGVEGQEEGAGGGGSPKQVGTLTLAVHFTILCCNLYVTLTLLTLLIA